MSPPDKDLYEFGPFRMNPVRRLLTRAGEPVPLTPKAFATLLALVERQGEVVEKDTLIELVWPDTFITEATLTQNVFRLRKALGEGAGDHRFIVTVPGRGYSFVAEVHWVEPEPLPLPALPSTPAVSTAVTEPAALDGAVAGRGAAPFEEPADETAVPRGHRDRWSAGAAAGLAAGLALLAGRLLL